MKEMSIERNSASKNDRLESEEYMMSSNDSTLIEFTSNYHSISSKFNCIDDSVRDKIVKLLSNDTQDKLTQLYTDTINIYSFASQYDYSSSVPFNGFRLICKMIFIYFNRLSLDIKSLNCQIGYKTKKHLIDSINQLVDYLPLLVHQMHGVKLAHQLKLLQQQANNNGDDEHDVTFPLEFEIVQHMFKLKENDTLPFYQSKAESFWLPKSLAKFMRLQNRILLCFTEFPLHIGIQGILNANKYSKMAATQLVKWTPIHLKSEHNFVRRFAKSPKKSLYSVNKFNLSERQSKWIIDKELSTVIEKSTSGGDDEPLPPVRLHILKPKNRSTDNVIMQIHGGGWAIGSPEVYYGVMSEWIKGIGATIIAIDYSLAPSHKYPIALQEILDTYLWLTDASKSENILKPLGHVPGDIIVTGDSAGGNFSVALTILLAEISKLSSDAPKFPTALDLMYPAISPGLPFSSASSVYLDTILSPCKRLQFGIQYYTDDPSEGEKSYLCRPESPWFMNEDKLKSVYTKVNGNRTRDPLFHLCTYKSFDILRDVKLYVQAAEFDPLCDDAILICKLWTGPVQLDIMPDVIHAWPFFADKSIECRKATDLTNKRLKQAVLSSKSQLDN